jgi:hypothetical protein
MAFVIIAFVVIMAIAGFIWAYYNYSALSKIDVGDTSKALTEDRLLK